MKFFSGLVFAIVLAAPIANAADSYSAPSTGTAARYTFSWPIDGEGLKPRGGTTKGAPVTADTEPSKEWQALQAPSLSQFERDRRAILAMAGTYRVTFDFLEVIPYTKQDKPIPPYQSWGTEKVYVDSDEGKSISLVHILEMRVVMKDGTISEPMVTKHWRQDWRYEPEFIVEHLGRDRWERRKVSKEHAREAWSQTVYQVDESPRYASIGRWNHSASFSTWVSGETWRPLPRREWSVRDDYQVLIGTNRHTVQPLGWIQEENNLKAVLTTDRALDPAKPYVAREYGVARYERIRDADFSGADRYFSKTKTFWDEVRDEWSDVFEEKGSATLRGPVDKLGLFAPLFARADEIAASDKPVGGDNRKVIHDALAAMGAL